MALRELLWSWWWWCSCSLVIFKAIVWWNRVIDTIWFAWWSHKAYKYIKHSVFSCYVCCLWWLSSTRHPPKGSRQISLAHFVTYLLLQLVPTAYLLLLLVLLMHSHLLMMDWSYPKLGVPWIDQIRKMIFFSYLFFWNIWWFFKVEPSRRKLLRKH